jgi:hypothetical protein
MRPELLIEETKQSKTDMLKNWEVCITFYDQGCLVRVGCKTFAFSDNKEAIKYMNAYFEDPHGQREYWESKLSKNNEK